ncbi:MAG: SGNH/GDSL hydrolase family protein [Cytophagaceae bacterium]|nr:SGNH/GDSL hydrolase family protein [Cytophagaceae bacterium]MDW8456178.1 SGNH/GDSL hydrolase family protein [Cytophagaceae bacterium]
MYIHHTYANTGIRYLALGDSYTIGEGVPISKSFPFQLSEFLINKGISVHSITIVAQTGWRADQLYEAMNNSSLLPPYDLVTLLIGVNNEYQQHSPELFKYEFEKVLHKVITLSNNIFVLTIPDYGHTPFGVYNQSIISTRIQQYNEVIRSVCNREDVECIDITPLTLGGINDPTLLAADGLHPSPVMYKNWVNFIGVKVSKIFA